MVRTDNLTESQRRYAMSRVRSKDTAPEIAVRRLVHRLGYRFRLHRADLPGAPDLVFPRLRKVIFVHGCFWHGHTCPKGRRLPLTRADYWTQKLSRNRERDQCNRAELRKRGWKVLTLWECQLKKPGPLLDRLIRFLDQA